MRPACAALIVHAELLMPQDIEARFGMVGGNWHHGELAVEQMLFLRPLPGPRSMPRPLPGLWLAGAGCHPGGGISGAAGWNAAEAIIKEAAHERRSAPALQDAAAHDARSIRAPRPLNVLNDWGPWARLHDRARAIDDEAMEYTAIRKQPRSMTCRRW